MSEVEKIDPNQAISAYFKDRATNERAKRLFRAAVYGVEGRERVEWHSGKLRFIRPIPVKAA